MRGWRSAAVAAGGDRGPHGWEEPARSKAKVADELAVWDRSGLDVQVRDASVNTEVTLESAAEGERIVCSTGKDATRREFLTLLLQPSAAAAAA